ncbi:MAG: trypsin-like peptidase domain-containing protein [Oceanobacter sp.]
MDSLSVGANCTLPSAQLQWALSCPIAEGFQQYAGVALIPVDEKRNSQGSPALLHQAQPWMEWHLEASKVGCSLKLDALPDGATRMLLVVYVYLAAGPVQALENLHLVVDERFETRTDLTGMGESAIVMGEFYQRNGAWKFRALAEGSAYGLSAFGRRIGLNVNDAHPQQGSRTEGAPGPSPRRESATGTGFAVSEHHLLTCAHVIEDMNDVQVVSSLHGSFAAEVVLADRRNDLALLRVSGAPALVPLTFQYPPRCGLGETVVALGFPLSGLAGGGVHVTQGGVSSLFGLHNDASLLQFTAPIQPGSSGSPLLDSAGTMIGMVTSTITDAQNMNFAVKAELIVAFLDACGVDVQRAEAQTGSLSTAEMARQAQPSIWLVKVQS